jgi:hypothetical protein
VQLFARYVCNIFKFFCKQQCNFYLSIKFSDARNPRSKLFLRFFETLIRGLANFQKQTALMIRNWKDPRRQDYLRLKDEITVSESPKLIP